MSNQCETDVFLLHSNSNGNNYAQRNQNNTDSISSSCLPKCTDCKEKRIRYRNWKLRCIILSVILCILIFISSFLLVLCFADFTSALRNLISEKLGIRLPGYRPPDTLGLTVRQLEVVKMSSDYESRERQCSVCRQPIKGHPGSCGVHCTNLPAPMNDSASTQTDGIRHKSDSLSNGSNTLVLHAMPRIHNHSIATTTQYNATKAKYITQASSCWETVWEILHDLSGWKTEQGTNLETGVVYSKSYHGIGRVNKLQAYVDCTPAQLFKILATDVESLPEWNQAVDRSEVLEKISDNIDIQYMVMKPLVGGIVSRRDYVNLRHWKERNNVTLASGCATTHPAKPASDQFVRGENRPGGLIIHDVKDNPNRSVVQMAVSLTVGGWVPQWAVDQAMASSLMDMLQECRNRAQQLYA